MAYDPEARDQSNSAMVIAVVALVVVVLGALAWFATRPTEPPVAVTPTVERHTETETVREVPVPSNDAPDTVVVQPDTSNPAPAPAPSTRTETQVTINPPANSASTPPATNSAPAPAGDGAASSSDSTSGSTGY